MIRSMDSVLVTFVIYCIYSQTKISGLQNTIYSQIKNIRTILGQQAEAASKLKADPLHNTYQDG